MVIEGADQDLSMKCSAASAQPIKHKYCSICTYHILQHPDSIQSIITAEWQICISLFSQAVNRITAVSSEARLCCKAGPIGNICCDCVKWCHFTSNLNSKPVSEILLSSHQHEYLFNHDNPVSIKPLYPSNLLNVVSFYMIINLQQEGLNHSHRQSPRSLTLSALDQMNCTLQSGSGSSSGPLILKMVQTKCKLQSEIRSVQSTNVALTGGGGSARETSGNSPPSRHVMSL